MLFVIKRLIYIEFKVLWKGKKKDLEVQEDQGGLLPILGPLLRQGLSSPMSRDRSPVRAREPPGSMSRHGLPCVATGFPGMLGDMGSEIALLGPVS